MFEQETGVVMRFEDIRVSDFLRAVDEGERRISSRTRPPGTTRTTSTPTSTRYLAPGGWPTSPCPSSTRSTSTPRRMLSCHESAAGVRPNRNTRSGHPSNWVRFSGWPLRTAIPACGCWQQRPARGRRAGRLGQHLVEECPDPPGPMLPRLPSGSADQRHSAPNRRDDVKDRPGRGG
jgi:hypothetical protein